LQRLECVGRDVVGAHGAVVWRRQGGSSADERRHSRPRRIGFASHVGLLLDTPTIGVAKKLLLGAVGIFKDGVAEVTLNGELLGFAVYTKEHAKPVYVSPGHKVSFETALECFKKALKGHKLPEPLHLAHKNANKVKKRLNLDG